MTPQQRIDDWMAKYDEVASEEKRAAALRMVTLLVKAQDERDDLARSVVQTRRLQNEYFSARSPQTLNACRDRERKLDALVKSILSPQAPGLFDEKIKEGP